MFRLPFSPVRVERAPRPGRPTVRLGGIAAAAVALLFCVVPAPVRADFREAARKLVPATVVITRVDHSEKKGETSSTKRPAAAPVAAGGATKVEEANATGFFFLTKQQAGAQFGLNAAVDAVNVWCGVLLRSDGWIVTTSGGPANAELEVRLTDGHLLPARLVVDDRRTGLWLLKVALLEAPSVSLATTPVELGQDVVAAMMDGPKSRQIARGIVTALNRHIDEILPPLILTDLPVPEAAAGAPVANAQGDLIGLVSARGQGNDKHARVITAAYVNELFMSRRDGAVTTIEPGMLGISVGEAGDGKLTMVNGVNPGSPAENAGLQKGDRVDSIDGRQFNAPAELMEYVGMKSAGSTVVVKCRRGEKDIVATAVLVARPAPTQTGAPNNVTATVVYPHTGIFLGNTTNGLNIVNSTGVIDIDPKTELRLELAPSPTAPQATVVRVEKTDVEKRIDELRHDIGALTSGIDSIRSHLDKLGADVKALTESRNKK
jgi:S1-C subfamily serine protease